MARAIHSQSSLQPNEWSQSPPKALLRVHTSLECSRAQICSEKIAPSSTHSYQSMNSPTSSAAFGPRFSPTASARAPSKSSLINGSVEKRTGIDGNVRVGKRLPIVPRYHFVFVCLSCLRVLACMPNVQAAPRMSRLNICPAAGQRTNGCENNKENQRAGQTSRCSTCPLSQAT